MPIDYKNYPADWQALRAQVLERENNLCKSCGVANHTFFTKGVAGRYLLSEYEVAELKAVNVLRKIPRIVLTIAHLDHDIKNNDLGNLAALCQACHLRYDQEQHQKNAAATRQQKKLAAQAANKQLEMFQEVGI